LAGELFIAFETAIAGSLRSFSKLAIRYSLLELLRGEH
jgi:hypothetical protein